jgi:tetratricopeptide (TPR) repeat protein
MIDKARRSYRNEVINTLTYVIHECRVLDRQVKNPVSLPKFQAMVKMVDSGEIAPEPEEEEIASAIPGTLNIRNFLRTLHEEGAAGRSNVGALLNFPLNEWPFVMHDNPSWIRCGTFNALLSEAADLLETDPELALEITSFTLHYLNPKDIPTQVYGKMLEELLPGRTWLQHGKAFLALRRYEEAMLAADRAEKLFDISPVFVLDRTEAQLLRARIWMESGESQKAVPTFAECAREFVRHGNFYLTANALALIAEVLCKNQEWSEAQAILHVAKQLVERLSDERSATMFRDVMERCVSLGYIPIEGMEMPNINN